ncbi:MAG: TonB-dependent receptor plug domain-containing protein, partial [Crocinitomicaceae bacterium]|nr:TonB-dependent receptor plug domain-containing protein [Crocinitomicaceae bacterium]
LILKDVPYGEYTMSVIMDDTLITKIKVNTPQLRFPVSLGETLELEEVQVISGAVIGRRTPVPVTRISPKKIQEELGSRDIPMLLNATPGVYATQQGGGDGDARITVRGFDQRNVGVMIDGVPVNDMENGAVYWSNWFGLDAITSNIQVQRGLGATKLAMPSIGGTINILTSGVGNRKGTTIKQEYGTGNLMRSTISYNSGMMKNGFGVTLSGSYKQGDGWVDGTPTQGAFLYAKVQKKIKTHLLSLSAFMAPQRHGQRSFNQRIQYWDSTDANENGVSVDQSQIYNRGIRYNEHWGYVSNNSNLTTAKGNDERTILNERLNYYNKPQITLKDFWQVNKKLSVSNLLYASIGRGGGTKLSNYGAAPRALDGTIDWDEIIKNNQYTSFFGQIAPNIDANYSPTEFKSNQVLTASVNNHFWVGYLGQVNYKMSEEWSFSGGLDYRNYKGTHYREIKDLLGGDYFINPSDQNATSTMKRVGDKIADTDKPYEDYRDGFVQWAGVFGQAEYTGTRWTAFINLSGVYNGYKGVDYFQKKVLEVGDTTLRIGANDVIEYNGQTYNAQSEGLKDYATDWKWIPGGTFKAGASYILTEKSTVFVNAGYLSRTPMFTSVVNNNENQFFKEIKNERILALEAGYAYTSKFFGLNLNGYATNWKNKPFPNGLAIPDPLDPTSTIRINVNGMDAIHYGAELDLAYNISKKLSAEVMLSYGDWRWNSSQTIILPQYDSLNVTFDAKGVHVGDAPQSTYSGALRYEAFKNFYVKAQYMYFDRYYAQFNPFNLKGENAGRESWKIPGYGMLNLFMGYKYKMKKSELLFNAMVQNALNSKFIADATLSSTYGPGFDAASAGVMYGGGFRYNLSISLQF